MAYAKAVRWKQSLEPWGNQKARAGSYGKACPGSTVAHVGSRRARRRGTTHRSYSGLPLSCSTLLVGLVSTSLKGELMGFLLEPPVEMHYISSVKHLPFLWPYLSICVTE